MSLMVLLLSHAWLGSPCEWEGPRGARFTRIPTVSYGIALGFEAPYHTNWSTCVARERGRDSVESIVEVQTPGGDWVESSRRTLRLKLGLEPEAASLRFRVTDRECRAAFPNQGGYAPSRRLRETRARVRLEGVKELEQRTEPLPLRCMVTCPRPFTNPSVRVAGPMVTVSFSPRTDFVECAQRMGGRLSLRFYTGATEDEADNAITATVEAPKYTLETERNGRRKMTFEVPRRKLCRGSNPVVAYQLAGPSPFAAMTGLRQVARRPEPCR